MKQTAKGFTLIELMVVISIIGLLSTIVLVALKDARDQARTIASIQEMRELQKALEMYRTVNGDYPDQDIYGEAVTDNPVETPCGIDAGWRSGWDFGGLPPHEPNLDDCVDKNGIYGPFIDPLVEGNFISSTQFADNNPIYFLYGYGNTNLCYNTEVDDRGIDYALIVMNLKHIPGVTDVDECDQMPGNVTDPENPVFGRPAIWGSHCPTESGPTSYCILQHK